VVDGDPLTDILATRRVQAVWYDGRHVDLDAAWRKVVAGLAAVAE
jgi:hypothetical protein